MDVIRSSSTPTAAAPPVPGSPTRARLPSARAATSSFPSPASTSPWPRATTGWAGSASASSARRRLLRGPRAARSYEVVGRRPTTRPPTRSAGGGTTGTRKLCGLGGRLRCPVDGRRLLRHAAHGRRPARGRLHGRLDEHADLLGLGLRRRRTRTPSRIRRTSTATPGTYDVELVATNAGGSDTETKIGYVTVSAPAAAAERRFEIAFDDDTREPSPTWTRLDE